jgi:hypothetical protein
VAVLCNQFEDYISHYPFIDGVIEFDVYVHVPVRGVAEPGTSHSYVKNNNTVYMLLGADLAIIQILQYLYKLPSI